MIAGLLVWPKHDAAGREKAARIWEIQSIDTMKTSRDQARAQLNNKEYDKVIDQEARAIKDLGATHIAIGTPYDEEFLPYLKRWVSAARRHNLNVWFRGNFSRWEGWFDYPKDMSPEEHLTATSQFITDNKNLFKDGDAFDPCPECENAGHWPQPAKNNEFNEYLVRQHEGVKEATAKTGKNIITNAFSVIGGRAYEVMSPGAAQALDDVVVIDHYIKDPANMGEYVTYFHNELGARTLVGEFGAPIPDINGEMTEAQQAKYVDDIMTELYKQRSRVYGMNYYVLSVGTTALLNEDGSERQAASVLRRYYKPAVVRGRVTDATGAPASDVRIVTSDGISETVTQKDGSYTLAVPVQSVTLRYESRTYIPQQKAVVITEAGDVKQNVVVSPQSPTLFYKMRLWFKKLLSG